MRYGRMGWMGLLAAGLLLAGCGGGGGGVSVTKDNDGHSEVHNPDSFEAQPISDSQKKAYLKAINDARAQQQDCGSEGVKDPAPALQWNDALYRAADEHSYDMSESDTFSHDGSGTESDYTAQVLGLDHSTVVDRIENNGYSDWHRVGENIAAGTNMDTAEKAVQAWLNSPGHCANLMNPEFKEVGMSHRKKAGTHYINYWTQDFGARQ
ncbi:CAP domain-containing protein [Nitratifractor salsuginis]|uniref:SCP-like extracellular n=1 Tax=Nitratifractor salsuginis (strain DSM 16511 / JCM 12458 / E9I37-1) TaxID=749222 RepID=E6WZ31_NITSE|nr:CAP domain-containing protein [Nitratifractor salsuginis]ADV45481.1 SCP-like extracellular [Nitratifractor salsuginis DSM 16511]